MPQNVNFINVNQKAVESLRFPCFDSFFVVVGGGGSLWVKVKV